MIRKNNLSQKQLLQSNRVFLIRSKWKQLSPAQKATFNSNKLNNASIIWFGGLRKITAYQFFYMLSMNLLICGQNLLAAYVQPVNFALAAVPFLNWSLSTGHWRVLGFPSLPTYIYLVISASKLYNYPVTTQRPILKFLHAFQAGVYAQINVEYYYSQVYPGTLVVGQSFLAEFVMVDALSGYSSKPVLQSIQVVS